VRELEGLERLDVEKEVLPPGDIRRDGGREVDEAREARRQSGQLRQRVGPAVGSKGLEPGRVKAEAPRRGVSVRSGEIAPVFRDQPDTREHGEPRAETAPDAVEETSDSKPEEEGGPKLPFVDARTEDVDPWAKMMTFDSEHDPLFGTITAVPEGCPSTKAAKLTSRQGRSIR
jgi:hypothetical protein